MKTFEKRQIDSTNYGIWDNTKNQFQYIPSWDGIKTPDLNQIRDELTFLNTSAKVSINPSYYGFIAMVIVVSLLTLSYIIFTPTYY